MINIRAGRDNFQLWSMAYCILTYRFDILTCDMSQLHGSKTTIVDNSHNRQDIAA